MNSFLVQDWVGLRLSSSFSSFTQDESKWLDISAFSSGLFFVEARSVLGGGTLTLHIESSPSKDESLFTDIVSIGLVFVLAAAPAATVLKALPTSTTWGRWLRWRVDIFGPVADWGATFRIHCALNSVGASLALSQ